ncbi:hypothetical protein CHISP_2434 [Chitinispirillum alkaliphilum]|nr:hypothetical protein CHISP_2434 [Chitinispirillum alkaliphilum]
MVPRVIKAETKEDYVLELTFSNGEHRFIDISLFLSFSVFSSLKDQTAFNQVKVAYGTIEWPCGVDLDPDFLWNKSTSVYKTV